MLVYCLLFITNAAWRSERCAILAPRKRRETKDLVAKACYVIFFSHAAVATL